VQSGHTAVEDRARGFPLGALLTVEQLESDPHPLLAALRRDEPVSWVAALGAWLVTRRDLALQVVRDPATFTVDDPRFSTAQVVGRSMLSTDGVEHDRHRDPFARSFRLDAVRDRFAALVEKEVESLLSSVRAEGSAELRRSLAGPLAVTSMVHALGLIDTPPETVLRWYDAIVTAVTDITAGRPQGDAGLEAFAQLRARLEPSLRAGPSSSLLATAASDAEGLNEAEVVSNAAVLLFGGIETTEGMIANAILHLLSHPDQRRLVQLDRDRLANAVEESLRLEPAAAVVDRYATRDVELGGAAIRAGELVTVSLAGANRDPATFADPDRFDVGRPNAQLQLAFAQGPHVCLGMHLARVETRAALAAVLELPGIRLDPERPSLVRGLVFRKPQTLHVTWDAE
jgi:cytochrome P450